jgi:hypothetical protein
LTDIPDFTPPRSNSQPDSDQPYLQTYPAVADVQNAMHVPGETPAYNSLGVIGDMLNLPAQVDWVGPLRFHIESSKLTMLFSACTTVASPGSKWPRMIMSGTPQLHQRLGLISTLTRPV